MHCHQNYTYLSSRQYMKTCYNCAALVDFPVTILVFYCILKITPKHMQKMKWVLLNAHIWITNLDLILTVWTAPLVFFPSACGLTTGILSDLGVKVKWQAYWAQVSITYIGISVMLLYENRQSQIYTITYKMTRTRTRVVYYGVNYMVMTVVMIAFYLDDTDQVELKKIVLERIPCPTIDFFDPRTYVLLKGGETAPFYSITISTSLIVVQTAFYAGRSVYHLMFLTNTNISKSTRKLQRQYLASVSIQITIPIIVIILPVIYSLYADKNNYYNQEYNNNAMCMMANHGVLSSVSTLMIYKPYREFCGKLILRKHYDRKTSSSVLITDMATRSES